MGQNACAHNQSSGENREIWFLLITSNDNENIVIYSMPLIKKHSLLNSVERNILSMLMR